LSPCLFLPIVPPLALLENFHEESYCPTQRMASLSICNTHLAQLNSISRSILRKASIHNAKGDRPLRPQEASPGVRRHRQCWIPLQRLRLPRRKPRYRCDASDFDLHEFCATCPKTAPFSIHGQHPLTLERAVFADDPRLCNLCGTSVQGMHYCCRLCGFDVHPVCS
jgi:hypothetical protein